MNDKLNYFMCGFLLSGVAMGCGSDSDGSHESREIAASDLQRSLEIEEGQWIKSRIVYEDGSHDEITLRAQEKEGEYRWFDVHQVSSAYGNLDLRILGTPGTVEDPVGQIAEIEADVDTGDAFTDEFLRDYLTRNAATQIMSLMARQSFSAMEREEAPIVVPAGTFFGCYKRDESLVQDNGERAFLTTVWRHPAVPFSGVVLATDAEQSYRQELVDFGTE
ncbi:MAG: hypothetical protein H6714_00845 [Myxococcales bacterium]|nr:hypothetical protein [Myxococcales bacterium]